MRQQLLLEADFAWEIRRKDGTLKAQGTGTNRIVNTGLNNILDRIDGDPAAQTLYIGLIDKTSFTTGIAAADTMASHAGWVEFQGYDETVRQTWSPAAAASQERSNTTALVFTGGTLGTIKGIFVTTVNTKGGTTGTLIAAGALTSEQPLADGETLSLTYRLQASSGA